MTRRQKSRLSADDQAIWQKVARQITPLREAKSFDVILDMPVAPSRPLPVPKTIRRFEIGQKALVSSPKSDLKPSLDQMFANVSPNMDKNNFARLKKGKFAVEGRLDLHGMTLDEAHPALSGFVQDAHTAQKRLLLVITGKGKMRRDDAIMSSRLGVLRHQVPVWLSMAPLSPLILQVTQAHAKHGGGGAYYVYLRRQR
ncbi:MAG: DNA mismatch repair protein MutS [Alphaproteobacteria bacterium]|nr:DNA mismatch repair protein MutS [Alphaproteobacteria bacterium]